MAVRQMVDKSARARLAHWRKWLNALIRETGQLMQVRYIYQKVQEMAESNPHLKHRPARFRKWWMPYTYAHTILAGARRLADTHRDSHSLRRLLEEISDSADTITLDYYLSLYRRHFTPPQHILGRQRLPNRLLETLRAHYCKEFRERWGLGKDTLNPEVVQQDIERLKQAYDDLKEMVDRRIAHLDPRWSGDIDLAPEGDVIRKIDAFFDVVEELLNRYSSLILGVYWVSLRPQLLDAWEAEFEVAWKPESYRSALDKEEYQRRLVHVPPLQIDEAWIRQIDLLIEKRESGVPLTDEEQAQIEQFQYLADWLDEIKARMMATPETLRDESKTTHNT